MDDIDIVDAARRLREARRILVVGCSGSGKSTLTRRLSGCLSLPFISMDKAFFWLPGWQLRPRDEVDQLIAVAAAEPAWIMDGNSPRTLHLRLPRAELVLWMRPPRHVSLYGVIWRWLRHIGRTRPEMAEGCPERIDWQFLRYVWDFEVKTVPRLEGKFGELGAGIPVCTLKSFADADRLLAMCERDP